MIEQLHFMRGGRAIENAGYARASVRRSRYGAIGIALEQLHFMRGGRAIENAG